MRVVHAHELQFHDLPGRRAADPLPGYGDVSVRVVRVDPGPRSPHRHPRSVEVIYVLAGRGRHRQGDEERPVAPGDIVLVPAGVPHCTAAESGAPLELLCFFPDPDLSRNLEECAWGTSS